MQEHFELYLEARRWWHLNHPNVPTDMDKIWKKYKKQVRCWEKNNGQDTNKIEMN